MNNKKGLIEKLVKKDFNNELEALLEQKCYSEQTKNSLLNILYKIETSYKDIQTVKQDLETKEQYIEKLMSILYNQCDEINIIKMNAEKTKIPENKMFYINKADKEIECYPIDRKILYAIWKIGKSQTIIKNDYYLIDVVLSDLINAGNTIQKVEPIRDFNGYSWTTITKEIESIEHNLIYQNLRILLKNEFLEKWVYEKDFSVDYYKKFLAKINKEYGKEISENLTTILIKIAILLEVKFDKDKLAKYVKDKKRVENELSKMDQRDKYIESITRQKLNLEKEIRNIDRILNNKNLLKEEYIKRNENLPLSKKIFSMKVLNGIMQEEREQYEKKIEELNGILNPRNFIKHKKELENKQQYLKLLEIEDVTNGLKDYIMQFQYIFLKCLLIKADKIQTKQEIMELIYHVRYYLLLRYDTKNNVYEKAVRNNKEKTQWFNESLIKELILKLVKKAAELNIVPQFSKNEDYQYEIWKHIFQVRVINLEDLSIKIEKQKEKYYIQLLDEEVFQEKVQIFNDSNINEEELEIRMNKKIKVFE